MPLSPSGRFRKSFNLESTMRFTADYEQVPRRSVQPIAHKVLPEMRLTVSMAPCRIFVPCRIFYEVFL